MRNNRKLAGLLLLLLIGAIASVALYPRDRAGEVSSPAAANSSVGSPNGSPAAPSADTERPVPAAPPAPPSDSVAEGTPVEAPRPIAADRPRAMWRGPQAKATGAVAVKAKRKDAEPDKTAVAVTQHDGESSDRVDAGARPEQPPAEAPPPPRQMGTLVGRVRNAVGSTFRLTRASFFVDGSPVGAQDFPAGLGPNADVQVFERPVDVGSHKLGVILEYQGNGGGVFSYFEGYRYKVSGSHDVMAAANSTSQVTVIGREKGGILTSFENRLGVSFRESAASGP